MNWNRSLQDNNLNQLSTPPRIKFDQNIPLEYSPPSNTTTSALGNSSTTTSEVSSPFQSMRKSFHPNNFGHGEDSKGTTNPPYDPTQGIGNGDDGGVGIGGLGGPGQFGRGRGRGRIPRVMKFNCRVCNSTFDTRQLLMSHLVEKQHFNTQTGGDAIPENNNFSTVEPTKKNYSCRVCNSVFETNVLLYHHLKSEGHFNSSTTDVGKTSDQDSSGFVRNDSFPTDTQTLPQNLDSKKTNKEFPLNNISKPVVPSIVEETRGPFSSFISKPLNNNNNPSPTIAAAGFLHNNNSNNIRNNNNNTIIPDQIKIPTTSISPPYSSNSSMKVSEPTLISPNITGSLSTTSGTINSNSNVVNEPKTQNNTNLYKQGGSFSNGAKIVNLTSTNNLDDDASVPVFRSSKFPPKNIGLPIAPAPPGPIKTSLTTTRNTTPTVEPEDEGEELHADGQV